jgi:hypothetical protein
MQYIGNAPGKHKPTRGRGRRHSTAPHKEKTNVDDRQPAGAGGSDRPARKTGRHLSPRMKHRVARASSRR